MNNSIYVYLICSPDKDRWTVGQTNAPARLMDDHVNYTDQDNNMPYQKDKMVHVEMFFSKADAQKRIAELERISSKEKELLVEKKNSKWKDLSGEDYSWPINIKKDEAIFQDYTKND